MSNTEHSIPESAKQEDVLEALGPLCALLNITPSHFYDLHITAKQITLLIPAVESAGAWDRNRPPTRFGKFTPVGDASTSPARTLMQRIEIVVKLRGENAEATE